MGLYRIRKGGNWHMEYVRSDGTRVRRTTKTTDRKLAAARLAQEIAADRGRAAGYADPSPAAQRLPIGDHLNSFERQHDLASRSKRHKQGVFNQARRICKLVGARDARDLTTPKIRAALEEAAPLLKTRHNYLASIRAFCRYLVEQYALETNPAETIKLARPEQGNRRRALTDAEVALLLHAPPPVPPAHPSLWPYRRDLYAFALATGGRSTELSNVLVGDIDFTPDGDALINIRGDGTKNAQTRIVGVPAKDELVMGILRRRIEGRSRADAVFPARVRPPVFRKDCVRAGIMPDDGRGRQLVFHSLRNTFATRMALSGMAMKQLQELMGHADPNMTQRIYVDLGLAGSAMATRLAAPLPASRGSGITTLRLAGGAE
ncbi:MAG: site-specific integrase [Planctomycetota bacterium]